MYTTATGMGMSPPGVDPDFEKGGVRDFKFHPPPLHVSWSHYIQIYTYIVHVHVDFQDFELHLSPWEFCQSHYKHDKSA